MIPRPIINVIKQLENDYYTIEYSSGFSTIYQKMKKSDIIKMLLKNNYDIPDILK